MTVSKDTPVHIRSPERARPPGKAGEAIISRFEDIAAELSRAMAMKQTPKVEVNEPEHSFEVRITLGVQGLTAQVENGLVHVNGLPDPDGGQTSRTFTVPDDFERSLVDVKVENDTLIVVLPRTPETTRVVRHLQD